MGQMDPHAAGEPWVYPIALTTNSHNVIFNTENKFLDTNIKAQITVNAGTINKPTITNTNLGTYFNSGTSSSNSISLQPQVTNTAGFIAAHNSSSPVLGDALYYTIKTTSVSFTAGSLGDKEATLKTKTNIVTNTTTNNSGIVIVLQGAASASAATYTNTAGWLAAHNGTTSTGTSIAKTTWDGTTYYVDSVTVPSGKTFGVTNNGTLNVTSTGTTVVTSNSTSAGTITIKAKNASGDSANTEKNVVENGLWKLVTMAAANTDYYGRVRAAALTVTTSSTNDGMSTYFNEGTSSDKNVTITPKYTNTAGFKTANSTATNNGGTTYWKIKTANPVFDGGAVSGTATASSSTASISDSTNTSGIAFTTACTATRADVLYNGAVNGWVAKADDTVALTGGDTTLTSKTYYINSVTLPKDKKFTVTTTADTALQTNGNEDLDITNNAYRRVDITNNANGRIWIATNKGDVYVQHPTSGSGNVWIRGYNESSDIKVVNNGARVTTSVNQTKVTTLQNNDTEINTRANASWGTGWITSGTINPATFANTATANVTYVDISKTAAAPILIAGDYLYINRGYVDNLKISLARLIPDTLNGENIDFAPANYILTGYAAFDAAGTQITGTMAIYDGTYTVS